MSDVSIAPPPSSSPPTAPAPAPASVAHEVPVNENPTSTPSPLRAEAPERDPADRRRDDIKKAFDRAQTPPPKGERAARPEPKAAEAKAGHNNPPEETPKLNLKQPPPPGEVPRGDGGRFAPRANVQNGQAVENTTGNLGMPGHAQNAQDAQPRPPMKKLPEHAPFAEPPGRVSERARYDWADTPESVRGDVHRMHQEFAKAYHYYKDDAEAYKPLKAFAARARDSGTTLEKAFTNYSTMEQKLLADPIAGIDQIIYNLNLQDPETGRRLDIRDLAYTVLSQTPEQLKQVQQGNAQQAFSQQLGSIMSEIRDLKNQNQQMHNQMQFTQTRSAVDQFASTHPRLDELGVVIEQELKLGFDIETAYRRAELLHPATQADQTRTTSAQTRQPDRSISGSPDVAPSNGASRTRRAPKEFDRSPRNAIQRALQHVGGMI